MTNIPVVDLFAHIIASCQIPPSSLVCSDLAVDVMYSDLAVDVTCSVCPSITLQPGLATGNLSQRRTCLGLTLADTQFQSTTPNSEILHQRFDKCQVVIGNLILYKILDDDRELTFLNDIEEVRNRHSTYYN